MTAERIAATIACALVAAGLIAGFWLIGSPQKMRTQALDRRRADDLRTVAETLKERYASIPQVRSSRLPAELPERLRVLRPDGSDATRDPVTGERYGYTRESAETYRLCATFALADDAPGNYNDRVAHPAGPACFRFKLADGYWAMPQVTPAR